MTSPRVHPNVLTFANTSGTLATPIRHLNLAACSAVALKRLP
jgi:hypothetical protein